MLKANLRMRSSSAVSSILILVTALAMGSGSAAQEATRDRPGPDQAASTRSGKSQAGPTGTQLGIGDRLKITFFELIDVPAGGNAAPRDAAIAAAALTTFYQRMDLSGEYAIDQDGAVSFPRLGRFEIKGFGLHELQSELAFAFARVMGRTADVSVAIIERPPIYVLGPVKNPGAYKHVNGMLVLQAVALAGGIDRGPGRTSELIESVREMERLQKLSDQKKRLLARQARLDAESKGLGSLHAPAQLIALAGEQGADQLLAIENSLLRIEQARRQQQQNELASAAKAARSELAASKNKLALLNVQRDLRVERLNDLQKLMANGHTTRNTLVTVRTELSDIEARRQDISLADSQAETRVAQVEQTKARLALDNAANLMKAIAATNDEIADIQHSLVSTEILAAIMDESMAKVTLARSAAEPIYEVVRQGPGEPIVMLVKETSALMPGDVLKISMRAVKPKDDYLGSRWQARVDEGRLPR